MGRKMTPSPHGPAALDRLRELIEIDGRPITRIAREAPAPIGASHISDVKYGLKANPSIGTVAKILAALGRDWPDLRPGP